MAPHGNKENAGLRPGKQVHARAAHVHLALVMSQAGEGRAQARGEKGGTHWAAEGGWNQGLRPSSVK